MSTVTHQTVIELGLNTQRAEQAVARMQTLLDRLNRTAESLRLGGGSGAPGLPPGPGGGGGGSPALPPGSVGPGQGGSPAAPPGAPGPGTGPGPGGGGPGPSPGPSPGPGPAPPGRPGSNARQHAITRATMIGIHGVQGLGNAYEAYSNASMSLSAGRDARMTGAAAQGGATALGTSLMMSGNPIAMGIGGAISLGGMLFGSSKTREAEALDWRQQQLGNAVNMQRQLGLAGMLGNRTTDIRELGRIASSNGMQREELASALTGFGGGYKNALSDAGGAGALANLSRTGVSMASVGAYQNQMGPGAGGSGGDASRAIGLAMAEGLRGAKLDQYLQSIASNTASMASQGLQTNVGAQETFMARMAGTSGLGDLGERAPQVAGAMLSPIGSARQTLLSPFQGLGQAAVMRRAMSKGGGLMGALGELDAMAAEGPGATLGALGDMGLSGDTMTMATLAMAPMLRTSEGQALAGGLGEAQFGKVETRAVSAEEKAFRGGQNEELDKLIDKFGDRMLETIRAGNRELIEGINTRVRAL